MNAPFEVRSGERGPAAAMTLATGLVLLAYYFLKPARDSLFLEVASPAQLPAAFILAALVAAPVAAFQARIAARWPLIRSVAATLGALALSLAPLGLLLRTEHVAAAYLLYAWAGLAGALATSQIWLLAGALFDAGQAKRLFPLLGVGGIIGAIVGGEATRWLIEDVGLGAEDLLGVSALTLAGAMVVVVGVWRRWGVAEEGGTKARRVREQGEGTARGWRTVFRSRLLTIIVAMLALEVAAASFVDFQFKTVAWESFGEADALAAFLGRFYSLVSVLSLVLQLGFSGRLVRWFGVGGLLGGLPAVLFFGAGALLVAPGLAAATFLRGGNLGFKHSLERTGREMLFLPVPQELKKRTKLFIDLFVDRWFRGLSGALLLLLTAVLGVSVRWLTVPVLFMAAAWVVFVVRVRREYADAFRDALARREIDPAEITRRIDDPQARSSLEEALRTGGERSILYALRLAPAMTGLDSEAYLRPLVAHASPRVRAAAYAALSEVGDKDCVEAARGALDDPDRAVSRAAVAYLAGTLGEARRPVLSALLADGAPRARRAAAVWIAVHGDAADLALVEEASISDLLGAGGEDAVSDRRTAASLLGRKGDSESEAALVGLLDDPAATVAREAVRALGRLGSQSARGPVLARLDDRRLRATARETLVAQGETAVPGLRKTALSRERGILARRQAVRALGVLACERSVAALADLARAGTAGIRDAAVMALVRSRFDGYEPDLSGELLDELHFRSLAEYYGLFQARHRMARRAWMGAGGRLLLRTLDEQLARARRNVFLALALKRPVRDIYGLWVGLGSGERHLRANAVEYLDQILDEPWRGRMLPLAGGGEAEAVWETGRREFGLALRNDRDALTYLSGVADAWIRACAAFAAGESEDLRDLAEVLTDDEVPLVSEAAALAVAGGSEDVLTVIEKVILLQGVDVFGEVPGEHLAVLAAVAEETRLLAGDVLYREGEAADALYLVLDGEVGMSQGGREITVARVGEAFGTWALFDEEPRLASATAATDAALLRIDRDDFTDVLADHVEVAQGVLRTVARRLRGLASRARSEHEREPRAHPAGG